MAASSSLLAPLPIPTHQQTADPYAAYGHITAATAATGSGEAYHRPSSGAWTPADDRLLLEARKQDLNWSQIKEEYFPNKSPNACRKRHERLVEKRSGDAWDEIKLQDLAKEYMTMRKEIWNGLATRTGEKWHAVEAKCMSSGLKNLQRAARQASRRTRYDGGGSGGGLNSNTGYDDVDSGISGFALTPGKELDEAYSSPETSPEAAAAQSFSSVLSGGGGGVDDGYQHTSYPLQHQQHMQQRSSHHRHASSSSHQLHPLSASASSSSSSSSRHHHHHHHQHLQNQAHGGSYTMSAAAYSHLISGYADGSHYQGHRYSSSGSSNASINYAYVPRRGNPSSQGSSPYLDGPLSTF